MCRINYFPEKNCRVLSSNWRNPKGKLLGTVSARKRPSNNFPSRRESPASQCVSSQARCASFTGILQLPSGHLFSKGRVRTTVINPAGQTETNDFEPGDIWYFPRGHAHVLECLGNEPTHFILIFDNGYFSEFGTFSITDWIGHAPKSLLAKNFALPESAFDGFPTREVYFARGAIPPEKIPENLQGPRIAPPQTHKFRMLSEAPHGAFKGGREWRVDSTRFPISTTVTGVILDLEPGALRELHWHPNADEWQYVIKGDLSVKIGRAHV